MAVKTHHRSKDLSVSVACGGSYLERDTGSSKELAGWPGAFCFSRSALLKPTTAMLTKNIESSSEDSFDYLIRERIKNFWGYGNLHGDIWFVGMEEGHNESSEILYERFKATAHSTVVDIYDDMKIDPGHMEWFKEGAKTQSTYRILICILLYLKTGKAPTLEEIRECQIKHFGRKTSDHAVLELMPLPSKSINEKDWLYAESKVESLSNRSEYLAEYKPNRVSELHRLVKEYKPKLVLFYSFTYLPDWQQIADAPFVEVISKKLYIAKGHDTLYVVTPHPVWREMNKEDWEAVAQTVMSYSSPQFSHPLSAVSPKQF